MLLCTYLRPSDFDPNGRKFFYRAPTPIALGSAVYTYCVGELRLCVPILAVSCTLGYLHIDAIYVQHVWTSSVFAIRISRFNVPSLAFFDCCGVTPRGTQGLILDLSTRITPVVLRGFYEGTGDQTWANSIQDTHPILCIIVWSLSLAS